MFWGCNLLTVRDKFESRLSPPSVSSGSNQDLSLESQLIELPLYDFSVETSYLGYEVASMFNKYPLLPGVILIEDNHFRGMISRQRLLEYLIRPKGLELFLHEPLSVLYSYARTELLILPGNTPILSASRLALRRSRSLLSEPIIVEIEPETYRLLDFQELNIVSWQIRGVETQVRYERSHVQMIKTEKMASLGRLVNGVAHEILDPVGFIWGNLSHVSNYHEDLLELLEAYEEYFPNAPETIQILKDQLDFEFIKKDLPQAIGSITAGAERLKKLAASLQNFCHIDEVYPKPADINSTLEGLVLLLKSRLTGAIEISRHYGNLPPVSCYIGQLSQVFMNILTNAIDVLIGQGLGSKYTQEIGKKTIKNLMPKPRIEISTDVTFLNNNSEEKPKFGSRWVSIRIANNGPMISKKLQKKILDSFSIERRSDKETSLSMSYQIITANHGGKFKMRSPIMSDKESRLEHGTEFEILLPLT